MDDRYQNQTFFVRVYRWMKWKPVFFIKGVYFVFKTFLNKELLWDSHEKAYFRRRFIFKSVYRQSESKMKHYYHGYELFDKF